MPINTADIGFFEELHVQLRQQTPKAIKPKVSSTGSKRKPASPKNSLQETVKVDVVSDPCAICVNHEKAKLLEGFGNPSGSLLVVSAVAHANDRIKKRQFSLGGYSDFLKMLDEKFPGDYYCTAAQRCGDGLNSEATTACLHHIRKDIARAKVVLLLGVDPMKALIDRKRETVKFARSRIFDVAGKPALVTWDPLSMPSSALPELEADLLRAQRLATGTYGSDYKPQYLLPRKGEETIAMLEAILEEVKQQEHPLLSVDIESMYCKQFGCDSLDSWSPKFKMWTVGISWADYQAIAYPYDPDPVLMQKFGVESAIEHTRIRELTQQLLNFPCLTHTQFDAFGLAKYNIHFSEELHDSLLVSYALDEEAAGQNGVDDLAWHHTEEGGYKEAFKRAVPETVEEIDWEKFAEYNAHDADIERRIFFKLKEKAEHEGVWKAYDTVMRHVNRAFIDFTIEGVDIERKILDDSVERYAKPEREMIEKFKQLPVLDELLAYLKKVSSENPKAKKYDKFREVTTREQIDINKTWQLETLLYDVCGFTAPRTTDKGARSTDDDSLTELAKLKDHKHADVVNLIQEIRPLRKILSTYLEPYIKPKTSESGKVDRNPYIKPDGRVHPRFNLHIARTGRSSSEEPNFQNIINDNEVKAMFYGGLWMKSEDSLDWVRGILTAGDYAQFEIRVAAYLCRDVNMINNLRFDFHSLNLALRMKLLEPNGLQNMSKELEQGLIQQMQILILKEIAQGKLPGEMYELPYGELQDAFAAEAEAGDPFYKKLLSDWKSLFKARRTLAKESTFGPLYGQTPRSFAAANNCTEDEAEEIFETDKKTYPDKHKWAREVIAGARRNNCVTSVFGRRRHLNYSSLLRGSATPDRSAQGAVAALDRRAVNTVVQGPASDLNCLAAARLRTIYKQEGIQARVLATIHDSIFGRCHPDIWQDVLTIQQHVMTTLPIEYLGESPVEWKAELEYGEHWGAMKGWEPV